MSDYEYLDEMENTEGTPFEQTEAGKIAANEEEAGSCYDPDEIRDEDNKII